MLISPPPFLEKLLDSFLLMGRFALLISLLFLARLFSPQLTDSALSEGEYAEREPARAVEDGAEAGSSPAYVASAPARHSLEGRAPGPSRRNDPLPLRQPLYPLPGVGSE